MKKTKTETKTVTGGKKSEIGTGAKSESRTGIRSDSKTGIKIETKTAKVESKPQRSIPALIAGVGLALILGVLPVLLNDGYYDILDIKYGMIVGTCVVMSILILMANAGRIIGFFRGTSGRAQSKENGKTEKIQKTGTLVNLKSAWKKLSLTDKGVVIFFLISVVSTLQAAPYISQAFYGNEGRYNGLILNTAYTVFYFLVTRNLRYKPRYLWAFMCGGLIVCTLGITDFFKLNLLGLLSDGDVTFTSTIGNINSFTVFCGLMVAVSGGLFIFGECRGYIRAVLMAVYALSLEAMLMGNSDNTYLFLAAFFAIAPFEAFRRKGSACRYAVTVSMLLTCILALLTISEVYEGETVAIDSVLKLIEGTGAIRIAVIIAWALTGLIYYVTGRLAGLLSGTEKSASEKPAYEAPLKGAGTSAKTTGGAESGDAMPVSLVRIWTVFIGICVAAVVGILIWANTHADLVTEKWPQLSGYLVFNDEWGTYRGYIWRAAFEEYDCLAPIHQIFGTGPDTFGIYMVTLRYQDMVRATGFFYDSAHNEYIELLFTLGPIGLLAHLMIIAGTVKRCFVGASAKIGTGRYRGSAAAAALAVMGYASQAFININVPVVAPCFWALLTVGESIARTTEEMR